MTTTVESSRLTGAAAPLGPDRDSVSGERRDLARGFSKAVSELARVIQFRDRDLACCHGLSASQCHALGAVAESGGLTVNELAARLYLDKSTTSRIASGLETRGLLERGRHPEDGRIVVLAPSASGIEMHRRIRRDLEERYVRLLDDFDPEFHPALLKLVRELGKAFASPIQVGGGSCCVNGLERG